MVQRMRRFDPDLDEKNLTGLSGMAGRARPTRAGLDCPARKTGRPLP